MDVVVEADMNAGIHVWRLRDETAEQTAERRAKELERACKDFHDHCRDHRSLDWIRLSVVRRYAYFCAHPDCGAEYESEVTARACNASHILEDAAIKEEAV